LVLIEAGGFAVGGQLPAQDAAGGGDLGGVDHAAPAFLRLRRVSTLSAVPGGCGRHRSVVGWVVGMTANHTKGRLGLAMSVDDCLPELDRLHRLATSVLNSHVNNGGLCAVCVGVAFPCESAVLADHNTALL